VGLGQRAAGLIATRPGIYRVALVDQTGSTGKRPYRMQARAKAAEATREKILAAAETVFDQHTIDDFTLSAVAKSSGVTVQTVLRHFGNREGLLVATLLHTGLKMRDSRDPAPSGNAHLAIDELVDHYDEFGERILRLLAGSDRHSTLQAMTDFGRVFHREWCEALFAPDLKQLRGAKRERRVAQFVAITDIYVWKVLRRERGLSSRQTKLAMRELLEPLMERTR
jgi:AcrR family transcriptional regulator